MKEIKNRLKINSIIIGLIFLFVQAVMLTSCAPRQKRIVVWHWMTDRQDAFAVLSNRYFNETGIRVKFVLCAPSKRYDRKIVLASKIGMLPDIYGMLGDIWEFSRFINSGYAVDLSDELNANAGEWRNQFFKWVISENEFFPNNEQKVKPGVYGIPIDVNNIQMVYNKDLFKAAGLDPEAPPKTWEAFIAYGKKLRRAGITPFVSGWGELWLVNCFANNYAFNLMGEEKIILTIKGQVPYNNHDWIRILKLFEEMRDAGMYAEGITTMNNKKAEMIFANSQAAMAFNGSWCVNVYREINPNLNYGVFMPPRLSNRHPMRIWGGGGAPFVVNAKSKNKEEAIEFLKWLTAEEQQKFLVMTTHNLSVNREVTFLIPFKLSEFADDMDSVITPELLPVIENSKVSEAFGKGIWTIIKDNKSPSEAITYVDVIKRLVSAHRYLPD